MRKVVKTWKTTHTKMNFKFVFLFSLVSYTWGWVPVHGSGLGCYLKSPERLHILAPLPTVVQRVWKEFPFFFLFHYSWLYPKGGLSRELHAAMWWPRLQEKPHFVRGLGKGGLGGEDSIRESWRGENWKGIPLILCMKL